MSTLSRRGARSGKRCSVLSPAPCSPSGLRIWPRHLPTWEPQLNELPPPLV